MTDEPAEAAIEFAPLSGEAQSLSAKFLAMPMLVDMYDTLERNPDTGEPILQSYFGKPIPSFLIAIDLGHYAQRNVDKSIYSAGLRIAACLFHAGSLFDEIRNSGAIKIQKIAAPGKRGGGKWEERRGDRVGGLALCAVFEWLGNRLAVSTTRPKPAIDPETVSLAEYDANEEGTERAPALFHRFYFDVLRQVQPDRPRRDYPGLKKIDAIIRQYRSLTN